MLLTRRFTCDEVCICFFLFVESRFIGKRVLVTVTEVSPQEGPKSFHVRMREDETNLGLLESAIADVTQDSARLRDMAVPAAHWAQVKTALCYSSLLHRWCRSVIRQESGSVAEVCESNGACPCSHRKKSNKPFRELENYVSSHLLWI